MKLNFKIKDNIYIESNEHLFDLHNDFDFIRMEYEIEKGNLILYYKSLTKNVETKELKIIHKDLTYIKVYKNVKSENDFEKNDSKTISSLTFYPSDDRNNNLNLTYREKPDINDDIIYLFENDSFIRLNCNDIKFEIIKH